MAKVNPPGGVLDQGLVRGLRLLEQRETVAAGVAQAADAQRCGQRAVDAMADRIGDAQV